jgi:hypothetical protein
MDSYRCKIKLWDLGQGVFGDGLNLVLLSARQQGEEGRAATAYENQQQDEKENESKDKTKNEP